MRQTIDTAPRDGEFVIIVDDASGRFDVVQWLSESGEWVRENGAPTEVRPSHWNPISIEKYLAPEKSESSNFPHDEAASSAPLTPALPEQPITPEFAFSFSAFAPAAPAVDAPVFEAPAVELPVEMETATAPQNPEPSGRRRFAASVAAILVVVAIVGLYRHTEVAAFLTRSDLQTTIKEKVELASEELRKIGLLAPQPQTKSDQNSARNATQPQQAAETPVPKAQISSESNERLEALAKELAEARRTIDASNLQLRTEAARAQSLEQARDQAATALQQLSTAAEQSRSALEAEQARGAALTSELATARRDTETRTRDLEAKTAESSKAADAAKQLGQTAEATIADLRQSLQQERDKSTALARDLDTAQRAIEARARPEAEEARVAALTSELATARRDLETKTRDLDAKTAESSKAADAAKQLRQSADATTSELRQSLQQERDKSATLARDLDAAQRAIEARAKPEAEQARVAALTSELATARSDFEAKTRDLEAKAAESSKTANSAKQLRQTAEAATAELRQSLQQERDKSAALARDLDAAQRVIEARTKPDRSNTTQSTQTKPVTEAAAAQQQEAQANPEAARLIARASALIAQGNIGAARTVLERAVEAGSVKASFALAETYDPNILASWGTYGTRGDASKARELYAKAASGGIREAKDRINALRQ